MDDSQPAGTGKEYAAYELDAHGLRVKVRIADKGDFAPSYEVTTPGVGEATKVLMLSLRQVLVSMVPIDPSRIEDKEYVDELTHKYEEASKIIIDRYLPGSSEETKKVLIAYVINVMLGLGDLETPLADENLEEIAVNTSKEPVWVYHKTIGWCKTNLTISEEEMIYDDAEHIGRRVGRQITSLTPLMDAELPDGSRVNATLYPISQKGNTITIRKFGKNPWTMPAMIANNTLSAEMGGLVWLCIENEVSLLISGGTASGKTSFLNAMSIFMPPNRRIVSVEETRELTLPSFLHWIPMLTRQPNPEGKGEVTLYDLMINSLRQRPDIMLVGEVRIKKDAETLFEAIHTGHAVYGTVHADNAQDTVVRMTNPPIEVPKLMMNAFGGILTLFRHRRLGIRRMLEMGELTRAGDINVIYRWDMRNDVFSHISEIARLSETISLYGGFTRAELLQNIEEKSKILTWMVKNKVVGVDDAGYFVSKYYQNRNKIVEIVDKDEPYSQELISKV
jgi:flagellar protein FlaI